MISSYTFYNETLKVDWVLSPNLHSVIVGGHRKKEEDFLETLETFNPF